MNDTKPPRGWKLAALIAVVALAGCDGEEDPQQPDPIDLGGWELEVDAEAGTFTVAHATRGDSLRDVRLWAGSAEAEIEMGFGSFRFTDGEQAVSPAASLSAPSQQGAQVIIDAQSAEGALGQLILEGDDDDLWLHWTAADAGNRVILGAACDDDDHFLGLGSHAMDVDHVGQAFGLWTSEPGIGKVETEEYPGDWFLTGTRHASSYPYPFLLRPHQAHGLLADTTARVEVDLCASDPGRFEVEVWHSQASFLLLSGDGPLDVVESLTDHVGRIDLPRPWVFAPWNDAVRGPEKVREVATLLRESGAPSSVIWTEDWKGAEDTGVGYHLKGEWFLDEEMYPDAVELAQELEDDGFKWFAYFAPFVVEGTETWDDAVEAGVLIQDATGEPYEFDGVTFEPTSMVDLTGDEARDWVRDHLQDALDIGFDGWMADYAEWLPVDAVLASGEDAMLAHNAYPVWWQELHAELLADNDFAFFSRSGWLGAPALAPVVWAGDQRTSFDTDDGLPTIIPLGLGLSACGVSVFSHDVAGYQSVGNPPTTKELFFRWAWLGAFSPVLRTHHGAFEEDNWQFFSDEETTAHWAVVAREHMRLFPYRYGLARRAVDQGTPMVLPTSFLFEGEDWGRMDVWMLGDALLVAPVMEQGAEGRDVELPAATTWYDWWTHEPATSGHKAAAVDEIPVFAAAGTTVPTFAEIPDTLVEGATGDVTTLADVDGARVVYLFGGGGPFTEADGTTYAVTGAATGAGETEVTLTSGTAEVGGITVEIEGTVERTYTLIVVM